MSPNARSSEGSRIPDSTDGIGRRRALAAAGSTATLGALAGCVDTLHEVMPGGGDVDLDRFEVLNYDHATHDVTLELQQRDDVGFRREFTLDAKRDDDGKTEVDGESFREGWTLDRGTYRVAMRLDGDDAWTKQSYDATATEVVAVVVESGEVVLPEGT